MNSDPRGPIKIITDVERIGGKVFITRDCGHRSEYAPHFQYHVGDGIRCFACGPKAAKEQANKLEERQ